ncbi:MAG: hypothetical protein KKE57_00675 [Proteobacteria bacterium]|nr:hypothetical protein [Pseudomonadota bacterium]
MGFVQDFFVCSSCQNKDFKRIYNFSIRFYGVNFSDDLIYDKRTEEIYQCTKCQKTFSVNEIEDGLAALKKKRKMEA